MNFEPSLFNYVYFVLGGISGYVLKKMECKRKEQCVCKDYKELKK